MDFQERYLEAFQKDLSISPKPEIFDVLQAIFEDAMAYEPEPDANYYEVDEAELRRCCEVNLAKLKAIVQAYQ